MLEVNNHTIMTDEYDILLQLKLQLDLQGLKRFSKIIRSGNNLQTTCPFHNDGQERKPSFGILTKDSGKQKAGTCHCFACGWAGSFSEMVSNCFGYDDFGVYGNKWLITNFLSVKIENRPELELNFDRVSNNKKKTFVTEEELDSYREYHPYMWKRKMTPEVVELFDVGYDKKTECLTFPVRDESGNCLFVARRSVKTKFFQYPENVEKPLYGLYELYSTSRKEFSCLEKHILYDFPKEVIVCESMIDAITCWAYGREAVALNGLGTDLQYKQLRNLPCRKLILATDNDKAGMSARERIKKNVPNKIITQFVFPEGKKDINDLTKDEFDKLWEIF